MGRSAPGAELEQPAVGGVTEVLWHAWSSLLVLREHRAMCVSPLQHRNYAHPLLTDAREMLQQPLAAPVLPPAEHEINVG